MQNNTGGLISYHNQIIDSKRWIEICQPGCKITRPDDPRADENQIRPV